MALYPLFANLSGREVLVVGGGEVATRKIEALLDADAHVLVHAHALDDTLSQWLQQGRLQRLYGDFDPDWLERVWLVVAATDDRAFNARLADEAQRRRRLVNIVDDAELSSFHVPAVVARAPLQVAISSGGAAPMLARRLREQLEAQLDDSLGKLAALFARHRGTIRARLPQLAQRRQWFDTMLDGAVAELLRTGQDAAAEATLVAALHQVTQAPLRGRVSLIGCDDGDPGRLTLRALRTMNQADVLLYDAEVAATVQALARRDAERLPMPPAPAARQALLLLHAGAGRHVVWLQAGVALRTPPPVALVAELAAHDIACDAAG
ncbi:NAD(P)-dependent oxidoreductase [Lysobacter cavernae]|uniref:precorrin-2 dehydrogenase n=1 Tax=Lysobacter cavernae TaxID=1685901 RepID=A0ABV7RLJ7_9GAMM